MRYFIREAMLNLQVKLSSAVNVIQINFEKNIYMPNFLGFKSLHFWMFQYF